MEEMSCKIGSCGHESYGKHWNFLNCGKSYSEQVAELEFEDIQVHCHLTFYKKLRVCVSNVLLVRSPNLDPQVVSICYRVLSPQ